MKLNGMNEVYKGYFRMLEATVETNSGESIKRELFSRAGHGNSDDGVGAIIYDTKKQKYIFAKQFRVGLYREDDKHIIEVPAGTLEDGEDPKECMIREIEEELGYKTDNILPIGEFYVSPGGCSEKVFLYEAFVSEKVSEGGGLESEHEEIEIVEMSYDEMKAFTFMDAKTEITVNHAIKNKNKNIYTILEEINFDEKCESLITNGMNKNPNQVLFNLMQEFYENILNDK